jgi:hypothetical protein
MVSLAAGLMVINIGARNMKFDMEIINTPIHYVQNTVSKSIISRNMVMMQYFHVISYKFGIESVLFFYIYYYYLFHP